MSTTLEHAAEHTTAATKNVIVEPLRLHLGVLMNRLSDEEFFEFCVRHDDLRIERTSEGDLEIMVPTGSKTGQDNFELSVSFGIWSRQEDTGVGFDSSTCFRLPNGAVRSPDLAWVRRERWDALTPEEREIFAPLCPDFVVELRSRTDSLKRLQSKMEEYVANGARLGWLIDPKARRAYVYRPGREVEQFAEPHTLTGDPELPGFVLDVTRLWS